MSLRYTDIGWINDTADMRWAQEQELRWYKELAHFRVVIAHYTNQEQHHEPDSMDK